MKYRITVASSSVGGRSITHDEVTGDLARFQVLEQGTLVLFDLGGSPVLAYSANHWRKIKVEE
jgi:hypothetical protein